MDGRGRFATLRRRRRDGARGGHTHQQWARRLGERYYVNPGSVGLAYDHHQPEESFRADPCAEYAVLTVNGPGVGVEFRRSRSTPVP